MGGSSLGGLLTMHLGLRYPTAFGKLAVLSPSVWWDDRVILREVEALPGKLAAAHLARRRHRRRRAR